MRLAAGTLFNTIRNLAVALKMFTFKTMQLLVCISTPYTPNDAALRAYPGEASCGAYGNRNFWYMWQEWFGSTYAQANLISDLSISHDKLGRMYTGSEQLVLRSEIVLVTLLI